MNCPNCGNRTRVVATITGLTIVIRRRECPCCKKVFISEEYVKDEETANDEPRKIGY